MKENMADRKSIVVSIEGGDSTGKGTQTALLKESLRRQNLSAKAVEVPVKSFITWRLIYFMLGKGLASKLPNLFHLLQFVNKFWWQVFTLPSLLREYDVLIFDRWHGSYWVYGVETGLAQNSWLMKLYDKLYAPNCTVVLAGSRHVIEERDEYEKNASLQERVGKRYVEWARRNPATVSIVEANQEMFAVHDDIVRVLYDRKLLKKDSK